MAAAAPLTVGYWGIRGLGAPIRMMLMHKNIAFKAETFDVKEKPEGGMENRWSSVKAELRKKNPLINLPYIVDGDVLLCQSSAILAYLGRKYGMWGETGLDSLLCEQLIAEIYDLRNKMIAFAYYSRPGDDIPKAAKSLLESVQNPNMGAFSKLEAALAHNKAGGGLYLVSNHATAPDFHLWEMLDQFRALAKYFGYEDALASFPHLAAFHTKFAELPANARYLISPLHAKLPFNNKIAVFGSLPDGGRWAPGTQCDWHDIDGMY